MALFLSLGNGPKLFIERATWAAARRPSLERIVRISRENGEILLWLGRFHLIYTPGNWRPPPRGPCNGGPLPGGHGDHGDSVARHRREPDRLAA